MRIASLNRSSQASAWFDVLRWIAALYVVIFHLRPILFVGSQQIGHHQIGVKVMYGFTSVGYQFVMLFFVLSGFLIGSSVLTKVQDETWSWRSYLVQRLTRLWIVLIPALFLTWVWSMVERGEFHNGSYFVSSMNWGTFAGNILFLQGVLVPNFAQNLPLWSLAYEFWYYIMFPCVVLVIHSKNWKVRILHAMILVLVMYLLGKSIVLYFIIWLLGVGIALLPSPPHELFKRYAPLVLLFIGVLGTPAMLILGKVYITKYHVANFDMIRSFPPDFTVAIVFAVLLYLVFHLANDRVATSWFRRSSVALAGFSYTLYLTHYPIINVLRVAVGDGSWGVWRLTPQTLGIALLILMGMLAYAWIIAKFTEMRTTQLRKFIMSCARSGYRTVQRLGH